MRDTTFRFPVMRTLPLLGSFLFVLFIIVSGLFVGGYHPIVTAFLWLALIASGWVSLSDLLMLVTVREDGLQIRALSRRGIRPHLIPWASVQELSLSGYQREVLQLRAQEGVSISKWTLPAHLDLAQAVVEKAVLEPSLDNQPPGVSQAFGRLSEARSKGSRMFLHWQWRRIERELGDE